MNARRTPATATDAVLDVLRIIAEQPRRQNTEEPGELHSLEYERYVAQPMRAGRHPMWEAMWAEATAHLNDQTAETA